MNSLARFKYITYKRITKQDVRHGREKYTEKTERRYQKRNYQRLILIDMWMAYFACLLVLLFSGFAFCEFKEPSKLLYPIILYKSDQYCVIVFEEKSFRCFCNCSNFPVDSNTERLNCLIAYSLYHTYQFNQKKVWLFLRTRKNTHSFSGRVH